MVNTKQSGLMLWQLVKTNLKNVGSSHQAFYGITSWNGLVAFKSHFYSTIDDSRVESPFHCLDCKYYYRLLLKGFSHIKSYTGFYQLRKLLAICMNEKDDPNCDYMSK